jgi:small subunit ribosomal protein S8
LEYAGSVSGIWRSKEKSRAYEKQAGNETKGDSKHMSMTDPIADFLTRIRNAAKANLKRVDIPASSLKKEIARILKEENYIRDYAIIEDGKQNIIRIALKYRDGESVIKGMDRISRPGLRKYSTNDTLPRVINGLGIAVISTSNGVMTDKAARQAGIGGEVICYVW